MSSSAQTTVALLPQWYGNPYLRLLERHLESRGARVARFKQTPLFVVAGLMRVRPRIVHLHWLHPLYETSRKRHRPVRLAASLTALRLLRLTGVRIVWTAHNLHHHEAGATRLDRRCTDAVAGLADAIIIHGPSARERLLAEFPRLDASKVSVIPHGHFMDCYPNTVDRPTARSRLGLPRKAFVFLLFGQIRSNKGVLELIEAFGRLGRADAHLVIAGKPLSGQFHGQVHHAATGATNIHYWPGFISDDQVQVYLNACDAMVLPYREILTSGAAVLAMSFGRTCVVPRLGCFTDLLDDPGAFFYDPDGADGLVRALRWACENRGDLARRGEHNRARARQWDWDSIAEKTLAVYCRAIRVRAAS